MTTWNAVIKFIKILGETVQDLGIADSHFFLPLIFDLGFIMLIIKVLWNYSLYLIFCQLGLEIRHGLDQLVEQ